MKKFLIVFAVIFLYLSVSTYAQRGKQGIAIINTTGAVVNAYTRLTADASQGATSITVVNNELSTNFSSLLGAGDLVFIIQMQGATITYGDDWYGYGYINYYNNAGKYEFAQVASVSGSNTINLTCGLTQSYTASGNVQVVRVPRYNSLTINSGASLTCPTWDGITGGVLVVESLNSITNNGSVNVNGKGFRGGSQSTSISNSYTEKWYAHADPTKGGQKGEGIAGRGEGTKQYCKGAPANGGGGGNSHNCGGGGGCNVSANLTYTGKGIPDNSCPLCSAAWNLEAPDMYSTSISYGGGRGGYSFSANDLDASTVGPGNTAWAGTNRENDGGNGGWPLNENQGLFPRLFLGGGGGGGHANDNEGGAGGNGGGLIYFISYGGISGTGTFYANGMPGGNSEGATPGLFSSNSTGTDGSGGGGGGGTIVLNAVNSITNVSAWADGGKGGDQIKKCDPNPVYSNDEAEGPGGGGGGGYIAVSGSPSITRSTAGGVNGTTTATPASHNSLDEFPPNGATKGGPGINNGVVTNFYISTPNVTACQGQPITLTATLQGSVPSGVTYGWYDQIVGGSLLSSQLNLTLSNPQVQDTFYFGTCPGTYRIPVIMYVSAFLPSAGNDVQFCVGNSVGMLASCSGCISATYNWSPTTGLNNSHIANPICSATTTTTYTVTIMNQDGCSATDNVTATVFPNNTVSLSSAAGTNAQTKCVNTALTNITYSTTGATGATITGLPAGVTGTWASNTVTIIGTPTVSGVFTFTVALSGGCGTVTTTGTITVIPDNTMALTSAAGTNAQTNCINTAITNITYGTTGATGASFAGLPAGVSGSWTSNTVTISGSPTVSGTFTYTVTLNGGCGTAAEVGNIIVVPDNTITPVVGGNQSVCVNSAITTTVYSTTGATGAVFSGLPSGVTGIWASNVVTVSGTPTVTGTFTYSVTLNGGCGNVFASHTIIVTGVNTINLSSLPGTDAQQCCINTPLTNITYTTTGATGATFSGLPQGITGSWASQTVSLTGTPTVAGTYTYSITLTGGCGIITTTGTITVAPDNTIVLSSAAGTNAQTVCVSTPISNITYTTTGATGATISGLPAGVSGYWASNTVTISGTPTVTGTYSYTIVLAGGCGTMPTSGTINVVTNNTIALGSASGTDAQTLCINTALTTIVYNTGGATGAVISGLPAGVNGNWASNAVTISGTSTASGTFVYTIALTGGCGTISATGSITVNPMDNPSFNYPLSTYCQSGIDPAANITGGFTGTFSASPGGLTFINTSTGLIDLSASSLNNYLITFTTNGNCPASSTFTVDIISSPSAGFNYSGPYCQNDANPLPTLASGAMAGTFSAAPSGLVFVNTGTGQVNLAGSAAGTYTVTNNISATAGCPAVSATASITINALPTVVVPLAISVCNNEVVPDISLLGVPFGSVVAWSNSNTSIGLGASGTGTIASFTAINTGTVPVTATITLTPSANNCTGNDTTFTITVNPTPAAVVPSDITVCNGETVSSMSFTSQTPGASFSWTNSNTAIGLASSGTDNIAAFAAVNTTTVPVSATITVTPAANGCVGSASTYTITVNPSPLAIVPSDTSLCHGALVPGAVFTSSISGATFTWINSSPSIGIPASGSGNVPSFTAVNSGTSPITANISVTASANSCAGQPVSYTITVNPLPEIVMNNTLPQCPGLNNGTITPGITAGTPPYQFLWNTGADTDQLTDIGNGTYIVAVTDSHGCQGTNSLDFDVVDDCLDPVAYVPNIFSPNGDNNNDVIFVHGQDIKTMQWMIYDRWGEKIFASEDVAVGWDGTYKGKEMPAGVYVFRLTLTFNDGTEIEKKGNITLVR